VREGLNPGWLFLVVLAFCLPLFVGLGRTDLANDEAIYSYAVESILETGDWLSPRASPNEDIVFLEKPPLKFWIVAAPIHFGILPANEFGFRFWDAVFGSLAFLYVFLIGRRIEGPLCGAVAVLVLFAHEPLLFDHGLRSNNMDAALVLAYCGGVYHYLAWASAAAATRRARGLHIAAVGGWFFLGFMTKFVAALFLPLVIGIPALLFASHRRALRRDALGWAAVPLGVVTLAAPWFVYQYTQHGRQVWLVMFGEHVYTRFTAYADPSHLQPWHFYFSAFYRLLLEAQSAIWVGLGLLLLLWRAWRDRGADAFVLLAWALLPPVLISVGTSKLYHYFYPYVPPFALAAGYGVSRVVARLAPAARPVRDFAQRSVLRLKLAPAVQRVLLVLAVLAIALSFATLLFGPLRLPIGGVMLRNSSIVRPLLVALVLAFAAGRISLALSGALLLTIVLLLPSPLAAYMENARRTPRERHPFRSLGACVQQVAADGAGRGVTPHGVYAPLSAEAFIHPYFFYLRRAGGWHYRPEVNDETMRQGLFVPGQERPIVIDTDRYAKYLIRTENEGPLPAAVHHDNVAMLLPGPYGVCQRAWAIAAMRP
jgi:4-amino-4-deoxy-L-arabinose transferase-like glycosyltransferase